MPFSPLNLLLLILAVAFLFALVQVGLLTVAFEKLGLPPGSGLTFLFGSLLGSLVNLPVLRVDAQQPTEQPVPWMWQSALRHRQPFNGTTLIGINLGGCILPLGLALYLIIYHQLAFMPLLLAVSISTALAYLLSRPIPGIGIGMPMFAAPILAALIAIVIAPDNSAPLAYVSGTLGVLIGADLLRLKDIPQLGTPVASIGGAGTFDGIFLTGLIAAILA
jgi:uncharacterized membrane protein